MDVSSAGFASPTQLLMATGGIGQYQGASYMSNGNPGMPNPMSSLLSQGGIPGSYMDNTSEYSNGGAAYATASFGQPAYSSSAMQSASQIGAGAVYGNRAQPYHSAPGESSYGNPAPFAMQSNPPSRNASGPLTMPAASGNGSQASMQIPGASRTNSHGSQSRYGISPQFDDMESLERMKQLQQQVNPGFAGEEHSSEDDNEYEHMREVNCGGRYFLLADRYNPDKVIGAGTYGVVLGARDMLLNKYVAVKKISSAFEHVMFAMRTYREVKILRECKHPNLLKLHRIQRMQSMANFNEVYLITDYFPGSLTSVSKQYHFHETSISYILYQLLCGLQYLHDCGVIHRDITPNNILMNNSGHVSICDFGMARRVCDRPDDMQTDYVCTLWYRAPEILLMAKQSPAVDVWSAGCILAELLRRQPMFPGGDSRNQIRQIIEFLGTPAPADCSFVTDRAPQMFLQALPRVPNGHAHQMLPRASPEALDLLMKMLAFNPAKRITAAEALQHPFFNDIRQRCQEHTIRGHAMQWEFKEQSFSVDAIRQLVFRWSQESHHTPASGARCNVRC